MELRIHAFTHLLRMAAGEDVGHHPCDTVATLQAIGEKIHLQRQHRVDAKTKSQLANDGNHDVSM